MRRNDAVVLPIPGDPPPGRSALDQRRRQSDPLAEAETVFGRPVTLAQPTTAFVDSEAAADLIAGMARDLVLVPHDRRAGWLGEFVQAVGSDMPSEVVDELVARLKAKVGDQTAQRKADRRTGFRRTH